MAGTAGTTWFHLDCFSLDLVTPPWFCPGCAVDDADAGPGAATPTKAPTIMLDTTTEERSTPRKARTDAIVLAADSPLPPSKRRRTAARRRATATVVDDSDTSESESAAADDDDASAAAATAPPTPVGPRAAADDIADGRGSDSDFVSPVRRSSRIKTATFSERQKEEQARVGPCGTCGGEATAMAA